VLVVSGSRVETGMQVVCSGLNAVLKAKVSKGITMFINGTQTYALHISGSNSPVSNFPPK
jgi:hypothetical protein